MLSPLSAAVITGLTAIGLVVSASCAFYWDMIKQDRVRASYHLAWLAIFLAVLVGMVR